MLLKTSFPYTGGFLCCPNKMVRFNQGQPGFLTDRGLAFRRAPAEMCGEAREGRGKEISIRRA